MKKKLFIEAGQTNKMTFNSHIKLLLKQMETMGGVTKKHKATKESQEEQSKTEKVFVFPRPIPKMVKPNEK